MDGMGDSPYEAEARERWGDTEAYKESRRRAKQLRPEHWARIKAEGEAVEAGMAALLLAGEPPDGAGAMDLAEKARLHIHRVLPVHPRDACGAGGHVHRRCPLPGPLRSAGRGPRRLRSGLHPGERPAPPRMTRTRSWTCARPSRAWCAPSGTPTSGR